MSTRFFGRFRNDVVGNLSRRKSKTVRPRNGARGNEYKLIQDCNVESKWDETVIKLEWNVGRLLRKETNIT